MVSIVERLLVLNTFQKSPKSWLLNKSGYNLREVNGRARTVSIFANCLERRVELRYLLIFTLHGVIIMF